jgi:hypothetical protein
MLILHYKVVQVVSQIVGACRSSVAIEHAKETDLRPLYVDVRLAFRFEDV